jgi:hypothetical protein
VLGVGNASAFAADNGSRICWLKDSPTLPQNSCGHDRGTLRHFCAALIPPPNTCYNLSSVPRGASTGSISFQRWIDLAYSLIWTLQTPGAAHGHEVALLQLLMLVKEQG